MLISSREKDVLAKGEYEYLCDGAPMPVNESWALSRNGNGFALYSQREISALSVEIVARAELCGGHIQRCLLHWIDTSSQRGVATASYRAGNGEGKSGIYRFRSVDAPSRSIATEGLLYFPLLRIFAGQLLGQLAARENCEARVLVPWIQDPAQTGELFKPDVSRRRARYLKTVVSGNAGGILDFFEYSGGRYERGAEYCLERGLLREYRWLQGDSEWVVRLKNLVGPWPGGELWPCASAPSPVGAA